MYDFHLKLFEILPEWVVLWAYPLGTLLVMSLLAVIFRKLVYSVKLYDEDTDVIDTATQNSLSAAYVIMGFTLVLVMGSADTYETNVRTEGTQIESLDRLLILDGSKEALAMRKDLLQYAHSVIKDDWPMMNAGGSPETEKLMDALTQNMMSLAPDTVKQKLLFDNIVNKTDQIIHSREIRLSNATGGLPVLFWTISYLYLLGVAVICALRLCHATPIRIIALSTQVTMLALIFSAVMIIDHPYSGQTKISAEPIEQAVKTLQAMQGR